MVYLLNTMSRLSDYLRAEQPDYTEPASFYVPGAESWREARFKTSHSGGRRKQGVDNEIQIDTVTFDQDESGAGLELSESRDLDEFAAAQEAAALLKLEG